MTYDELVSKVTKVLEEPDSALVNIKPVLEEAKADYISIVSLTEKNEKNEKRIRDLQDTNMKLFLAQTGKVSEGEPGNDDDDDLVGQDAVDAFINKFKED